MNTRFETFPESKKTKKKLSSEQQRELFGILRSRFEKNMDCHPGLGKVQAKLEDNVAKLSSLMRWKTQVASRM